MISLSFPWGTRRYWGRVDPSDPTWAYDPVNNLSTAGTTHTYGVVVHSPQFINKHLPWGTTISVGYNDASNINPSDVGFDVFRFEDGRIVEHWDNLQETAAKPSPSGHTMLDGPTAATELDRTAANKALMLDFGEGTIEITRTHIELAADDTASVSPEWWPRAWLKKLLAAVDAS